MSRVSHGPTVPAAVGEPVCVLAMTRGDRQGLGWVGSSTTVFDLSAHGGSPDLTVPTPFVPDALARMNNLGPRPVPDPSLTLRCRPSELATLLATRAASIAGIDVTPALAEAIARLNEHWRIEARWRAADGSEGMRVLEVLDTTEGLWLVISKPPDVTLEPTTATVVFRRLSALLPRDDELAC